MTHPRRPAPIVSPSLRWPIVLAACAFLLSACSTWRPVADGSGGMGSPDSTTKFRVELRDGTKFAVRPAWLSPDTLYGRPRGTYEDPDRLLKSEVWERRGMALGPDGMLSIPRDSIRHLEAGRFSPGRTIVYVLGLGATAALFLGFAIAASWHGISW
jgi:hypothetical protein